MKPRTLNLGTEPIEPPNLSNHRTYRTIEPIEPSNLSHLRPSFGDKPSSGPDAKSRSIDLDGDRVPAAVGFARRRIAERVLLAQLVGDARSGRVEIARAPDDFRAAAA